ncbi:MAG: branched-chain amino acid ABC transporter permease, partial [Actinophytocola sp.]|nr:branched-chain amino acid ABC transporter permease [Actinophytocola sp.]
RFSANDLWVMLVTWGLVLLCCALTYALIHSPWGRVLRSVREDEYAARALGKNAYGFKMQSLVLGGVIGGLAGIMLAINSQSATPDSYTPVQTFYLYTLLILGGAARVVGPVLGSVVFWFILVLFDSLLRQAIGAGYIPSSIMTTSDIGGARFALVGLGLILLMAFWPAGILGNRRELAIDGR